MLINMNQMLSVAKEKHFAVGAYNVSESNLFRTVVEAAEANDAPAIIAVHPTELAYCKDDFVKYMIARAGNSPVPFVIHMDHGDSIESIMRAVHVGFTSVMIDGSHESFEDNIALTASVARAGAAMGVPVEAELGKVGGKEDDGPAVEGENPYTDPEEAREFVERTGCTSLAIGVGTAHGVYTETPHIEQEVVKAIRAAVDVPLVLHGTSGVPDEQVAEAVKNGICKVNYATELRQAYTKGYMAFMAENPGVFDPKKPAKQGMAEITNIVKVRMENLGSVGRA